MENKILILVIFRCSIVSETKYTYTYKLHVNPESKDKEVNDFINKQIKLYSDCNIKVKSCEAFEVKKLVNINISHYKQIN